MSKIVIVNAISTFLLRYAVEINDDDPEHYAEDTVVCELDNIDEFYQKHIDVSLIDSRTVTKEEYIKLFDEEVAFKDWTDEQKLRYVVKPTV